MQAGKQNKIKEKNRKHINLQKNMDRNGANRHKGLSHQAAKGKRRKMTQTHESFHYSPWKA